MDIKTISDIIYSNSDKERMEEMNEVYYRMADYIKEADPDKYRNFVYEAECVAFEYDKDDAEECVHKMKPYGEHWTHEDVRNYLMDKDVGENICDYYVAMNMAYNDYKRTAEKYGMDKVEFYYDIAHDYIHDIDGGKYKVAKNLVYEL